VCVGACVCVCVCVLCCDPNWNPSFDAQVGVGVCVWVRVCVCVCCVVTRTGTPRSKPRGASGVNATPSFIHTRRVHVCGVCAYAHPRPAFGFIYSSFRDDAQAQDRAFRIGQQVRAARVCGACRVWWCTVCARACRALCALRALLLVLTARLACLPSFLPSSEPQREVKVFRLLSAGTIEEMVYLRQVRERVLVCD
jgi:hypothetical protein